MNVRDLLPWSRSSSQMPSLYRDSGPNPFFTLHKEIDRLFDDMFRSFDSPLSASEQASLLNSNWPRIEVTDRGQDIRVTAEVPGLEEKDIEVLLDDGVLILRGEKRSESEDNGRHFSERFYGRFERHIALGREIEEDRVDAAFKNGILTVTLPKAAQAQSRAKRIAVNEKKPQHPEANL